MKGKLFGLGVGPGDPELLTVKAVNILAKTKIIAVPQPAIGKPSLALKIAETYLPRDSEILELLMPMTEDQKKLEKSWLKAAVQIVDILKSGLDVAFLTLGDPSVYSTYSYVCQKVVEIDPEIVTEAIPGITSFSLAAARAGISLVEKDESLAILPVGDRQILIDGLLSEKTVVLMKISRDFDFILEALENTDRLDKAYLITRGGQKEEKIITDLKNLKGQKIDYMSLIISRR